MGKREGGGEAGQAYRRGGEGKRERGRSSAGRTRRTRRCSTLRMEGCQCIEGQEKEGRRWRTVTVKFAVAEAGDFCETVTNTFEDDVLGEPGASARAKFCEQEEDEAYKDEQVIDFGSVRGQLRPLRRVEEENAPMNGTARSSTVTRKLCEWAPGETGRM